VVTLLALAWWYRTPSAPQDYVARCPFRTCGRGDHRGWCGHRPSDAGRTDAGDASRQVALSLAGYAPLNAALDASAGHRMNVDYACAVCCESNRSRRAPMISSTGEIPVRDTGGGRAERSCATRHRSAARPATSRSASR
jgi:hypothetical protein